MKKISNRYITSSVLNNKLSVLKIFFTELKNLFAQHLYNSMLIEDKDMNNFNFNSEKSLDQLIPAVLISGFGNLVFRKSFMRRNGRLDYTFINEYVIYYTYEQCKFDYYYDF